MFGDVLSLAFARVASDGKNGSSGKRHWALCLTKVLANWTTMSIGSANAPRRVPPPDPLDDCPSTQAGLIVSHRVRSRLVQFDFLVHLLDLRRLFFQGRLQPRHGRLQFLDLAVLLEELV